MTQQPKPRSVLFLDIDGVMRPMPKNSTSHGKYGFSRAAVEALRQVVTSTGCVVVISSTWREDKMNELRDALVEYGLQVVAGSIIGATPLLDPADGPTREDEIDAWLHENQFCGRLAILDDEPFRHELSRWLVLTSQETGLAAAHAQKAINLLKSGPIFTAHR